VFVTARRVSNIFNELKNAWMYQSKLTDVLASSCFSGEIEPLG
jgi:hypothetical protein